MHLDWPYVNFEDRRVLARQLSMADKNEPSIDAATFRSRLLRFIAAYEVGLGQFCRAPFDSSSSHAQENADSDVSLNGVDAVLFVAGGQDEDNPCASAEPARESRLVKSDEFAL